MINAAVCVRNCDTMTNRPCRDVVLRTSSLHYSVDSVRKWSNLSAFGSLIVPLDHSEVVRGTYEIICCGPVCVLSCLLPRNF